MTRYFTLPYDCGQRGLRMGAGPLRLVEALGVDAEEITPASSYPQEVRTSFELYRELAARLRSCDDFPVVLSGHCGASIGALAGLDADAILWFDAHGDYNTPDTTDTGYLDGMCLAVATGRCWHNLAHTIPGFTPIDPRRVMHAGARDFSPGEREALVADGVRMLSDRRPLAGRIAAGPAAPGAGWQPAIRPASRRRSEDFDGFDAKRLLVHVDLDVIDARYGRANHYACDGGLVPDDVLSIIDDARRRCEIAGLVLASYDPSCDADGRIAEAAVRIVRSLTDRRRPGG